MDMQKQMQSTLFQSIGESHNKTVRITMTATYNFEDIEFDERALQGGVKEFKWHIREAWKNLSEAIQKLPNLRQLNLFKICIYLIILAIFP